MFDEDKIRYILFSIIIILELVVIGVELIEEKNTACSVTSNEVVSIVDKEENVVEEVILKKIKVDIKGAVKKEGVYELEEGSRVSDLVKVAGGLKSNASTKYLNLSKKLEDEMVIKVYTNNQIKNMNVTYNVVEECKCPSVDISSCAGASVIGKGESANSDSDKVVTGKISINNASKEDLMTLNGIGESKAEAIIEYRNKNNGFKTLEELMNVSGIGESAYNKIKDNITL